MQNTETNKLFTIDKGTPAMHEYLIAAPTL